MTFPNYHFHKKLIVRVKNGTIFSGSSDHRTSNYMMKTYVSFIFHTQININCKKCDIVAILIFFQFTPMYISKNFESAPAQVLSQLRHCIFLTTLQGYLYVLTHLPTRPLSSLYKLSRISFSSKHTQSAMTK